MLGAWRWLDGLDPDCAENARCQVEKCMNSSVQRSLSSRSITFRG